MKKPLVSVVIPSYNHESFVKEAIESVISQDYEHIEFIIIDDGSRDTSVEKIKELVSVCLTRFKRFEFRSRPNVGLCNTLNEALDWCEGKYFCAVASDDKWLPNKINAQVEFFEKNKNIAGVFGGVTIVGIEGNMLRTILRPGSYSFEDIFLHKHSLPAPTAMLLTEQVKKIRYDPLIKIEDWNMWLKLSATTGFNLVTLDQTFVYYRQHEENMSGAKNVEMMHSECMLIVSQFNDHPEYRSAVSGVLLASASLAAERHKKKSIHYFIEHLKGGNFSKHSLRVLLKILLPTLILKKMLK